MADAPRQKPGGASLQENVDVTPTQEARMRAQLHPSTLPVVPYVADGAVSPSAGYAVLTKGSAGAYTLAAPPAAGSADEGTALEITAGTAFAHVVTATGLIQDGVTGGAKTTMTFAAFVGASIMLRGYNAKWHVIAKNLVTIT
jgi:hypothetical protein